jgi:hypothetical protein
MGLISSQFSRTDEFGVAEASDHLDALKEEWSWGLPG